MNGRVIPNTIRRLKELHQTDPGHQLASRRTSMVPFLRPLVCRDRMCRGIAIQFIDRRAVQVLDPRCPDERPILAEEDVVGLSASPTSDDS